jgi:hypothetical protein
MVTWTIKSIGRSTLRGDCWIRPTVVDFTVYCSAHGEEIKICITHFDCMYG